MHTGTAWTENSNHSIYVIIDQKSRWSQDNIRKRIYERHSNGRSRLEHQSNLL